ncbi:MAG TPA: cysteine--tRNA ligase [Chloroflexota bacterium]|nr:cysteine--tRNA ligase [Chloroflexota bacterium]
MPIRLFNTLTGREEEFRPAGASVTMYVCGLTPKNHPHIGHAWLFVSVDVMRRYLEFCGYTVQHVQNFTDVDDKIIEAGHRDGIPPEAAAARYIDSYWKGMDALNVLRPTVTPYATEFIPQMIEVIQRLIDSGHAYPAPGGDVYYRVDSFPDYGKLSGNTIDRLEAGARVEPGEHKEKPYDFALWKAAKPGEPMWDSPWSQGRPGWHIECSTMINQVLGQTIDVHWGGRDLIFPHHENEIAQSEAYTGCKPFVRLWMHVGLMQTGSEKMAHSLGNFTTIHEMIKEYGADVLRMYLVSEKYRSPVTFSTEFVGRAGERLKRLRSAERNLRFLTLEAEKRSAEGDTFATGKLKDALVDESEAALAEFRQAMDDDLNTPRAIAAVEGLAKQINTANDAVAREPELATGELLAGLTHAGDVFHRMTGVLGLELTEPEPAVDDALIQHKVDERADARKRKDFAAADRIRQELLDMGVTIEDRPQGTIWYRS